MATEVRDLGNKELPITRQSCGCGCSAGCGCGCGCCGEALSTNGDTTGATSDEPEALVFTDRSGAPLTRHGIG